MPEALQQKSQSSSIAFEFPFVSVIMPVHNEAAFIGNSLHAILSQSYPKDRYEIIVADGLSADKTRSIVSLIRKSSPVPIKIVDNPKRIAPSGLNRAMARSKGDIIIRVDGHCEVDRDYIRNCVRYLSEGKSEGVGGPIETVGETGQAAAIAVAMSSKFGVGNSAFRTTTDKEMYVDTVAFPGYTREIIERAGPFDEELVRNQDDEFNFRIRKLGGRILLAPDIRSRYYSRSSFRSLWRQYFQYGFWKVRVLQLHPRQMSIRQFVPVVFVLSLLVCVALAAISPLGQLLLSVLVTAYLLATIYSSVTVGVRRKPSAIPLLPLAFAVLHLSYGLGFLCGLLAFAGRWQMAAPEVNPQRPDSRL
jgi:glycosyltransferase involved in cell wall biosynthesis